MPEANSQHAARIIQAGLRGRRSRVEVNQHVVAKFARIFPREDILHVIQAFDTTRVDAVAAKLERAREQLDR